MIQIAYRTLETRARPGAYGALMRLVSGHPLLAGFLGGVVAILIALTQGWEGASAIPDVALAICVVVLVTWMVLFFLMRGFFASQTTQEVEVVRAIFYDGEVLTWERGTTRDDVITQIERPIFRIARAPGASIKQGKEGSPWEVFVIAAGIDDTFVLSTKLAWSEARGYPNEGALEADESLPTHVASPLLELGRASGRDIEGVEEKRDETL